MDYTINRAIGQVPQRPCRLFIQMSGAPGSGKSTMARLLQQSIGGLVIDHDILRSALLDDNINDIPFDKIAQSAYRLQWTLAQDVLKQGLNVIIDSTCNFQEVLDRGCALAEQHGFVYWYVECKVEDIDLLDQRLHARNPMRSQRTSVDSPPDAARSARAGEDTRARFKAWIKNPCRPERNAIILDSTANPEMHGDRILKHIVGQSNGESGDGPRLSHKDHKMH